MVSISYLGNALNVPILERQTLQLKHSQVLVELDAVDDRLHEAIEDEPSIDNGLLAEESSAVFRIDGENHICRRDQPHYTLSFSTTSYALLTVSIGTTHAYNNSLEHQIVMERIDDQLPLADSQLVPEHLQEGIAVGIGT